MFATTIGTAVDAQNVVNRHFKPLLRRAGLPEIRWHDLRHTCAMLLAVLGSVAADGVVGGAGAVGSRKPAFPWYAAARILAFMLGSKVLSPQYVIWFFHPIFYSAAGMAGVGVPVVFLAACWMATHVFPIYCGNLVNLRPPGTNLVVFLWGVLLVVARNNPEKETW